ncbi:hypothetical protein CN227_15065 [Sinorhizobium meliloti]|uniref:hypothetical protein n=1 Tax=Rhizobium meliloti TaxID=382 RepID=UPI000FDC4950|nr:hypothetical protein [Sinorhizobium meliloti]MDW9632138.1 hypothetical protein [Sinorhizobium meliloti]RVE81326.1 hypothetical protein CN240_15680 [Sinorhizobium meliloti]RVG45329.1 hypothetical protein CN227_15065 [Sinorhizobium meliloti]
MTGFAAMLVAHLTDPIRVGMMALALWVVWKATDPGWGRVVPVTVAIGLVAAVLALMLQGMGNLSFTAEETIVRIIGGCISNTIIALLLIGLSRAARTARS